MLITNFNSTIDIWITELEHYSLDDLCRKPDAESWSLGQVAMHLIEETEFYFEQIKSCLKNKENSTGKMSEGAKAMFINNEFPDERFKGDPFISENVKQPMSKWQLQEELQAVKLEAEVIRLKVMNSASTGKARHPGLGYLSAEEWFQYAEMHLRHHLKQKQRIEDSLKLAK